MQNSIYSPPKLNVAPEVVNCVCVFVPAHQNGHGSNANGTDQLKKQLEIRVKLTKAGAEIVSVLAWRLFATNLY